MSLKKRYDARYSEVPADKLENGVKTTEQKNILKKQREKFDAKKNCNDLVMSDHVVVLIFVLLVN